MLACMVPSRRLSLLVTLTVTALFVSTLASPPTAVAADTRAPSELSLESTNLDLHMGETMWLRGALTAGAIAMGGSAVLLQHSPDNVTWTTLGTTKVTDRGSYTFATRPITPGYLRTYYGGSGTVQPSVLAGVAYRFVSVGRALEARAALIGPNHLEASSSDVLSIPVNDVVSTTVNGAPVRYQTFAAGTLVEYGAGSSLRTWFVTGEANRVYWANGGPSGRFGVPIMDANCALLEAGCLQRFSGGSVYSSPVDRQTGIFFGSGRASEVIATALSEVGYRAPSSNISRYNVWMGSNYPWCSIFQSWVSMASGNGSLLPVASRFSYFHSTAMSWGRTGSTPAIGALAFFDTHTSDGVRAATHVGLVYSYNSQYIWTIEGNTTPNDGSGGRGVYLKKRTIGHPMYYAYPAY